MDSITLKQAFVKHYNELNLVELVITDITNSTGFKKRGRKMDTKQAYVNETKALRAGAVIKELIIANNLRFHWVFTYANELEGSNRELVMRQFNEFTQVLRDKIGQYHYMAVLEVQQNRKEATGVEVFHIHMATDKYIEHSQMSKIWRKGFCWVSQNDGDIEKVAGYLSKYVKKDFETNHQYNKKRYLNSQGLIRAPKTRPILTLEQLQALRDKALASMKFQNSFLQEWLKLNKNDFEGVFNGGL